MSNALRFPDFEPWDLRPVIRKMIEAQDKHSAIYSLASARLLDTKSGVAELSAYEEGEALGDAFERAEAIKS
jgi:hypothetical protein